jgi:hypothetical protein
VAKYGNPYPSAPDTHYSDPGRPGIQGLTPSYLQQGQFESGAFGNPGRQRRWNTVRELAGPAGDLLPQHPITHAQLGAVELGLNEQNRRRGEQDFQSGLDQGVQGRSLVGSSPAASMAREIAMQQIKAPGPGGAIRSAGAVSAEDLRRLSAESSARRGLGGGAASYDMMQGQRMLAGDIAERSAMADEAHMAQALGQLSQISQFEQVQRDQYTRAIMDALFNVQRGDYDISGLSPALFR